VELVYIDKLIKRLVSLKSGRNKIMDIRGKKMTLGEIENILLSDNPQGNLGETLKYFKAIYDRRIV